MSPETSAREVFDRLRIPGALALLIADAALLLGVLATVVTTSRYGGDLTIRLFSAAGSFLSLATLALPVVALVLVAVVRPVRTEIVPIVAAGAVVELGASVVLGLISTLAGLVADIGWQSRLIGLVEAFGWLAAFLLALLGSVQTLMLKRNPYAGHGTTVGEANGGLAPEARWGTNPQPSGQQSAAHPQVPPQPAATGRAAAPQAAPPSGAWSAQAPWSGQAGPGQAAWPAQPPQPGYPGQAPPQPPYPGPPPPPSAHEPPPPPPSAPPPSHQPPPAPPAAQQPPPAAHHAPPPAPPGPQAPASQPVSAGPPAAPAAPAGPPDAGAAADTGRPSAQATTFVRASDLLPNLDELSPGPDRPLRAEQRPPAGPAEPGPSVDPPKVSPGPRQEAPTTTGPGIADAEPELDEDDTITRAFRVSSPEEPPAR